LKVKNQHITGKHNKLNLITCCFIAFHFYPELQESIESVAREFKPTKNRSEWITFKNKEIFLDAYNANPSSMKVALSGFKESILEKNIALGDACVILGDMNELGEKTPDYHEDVGIFVKSLGFSQVFFVGRFADHYLKGFPGGHKKNSVKEFREEFLNNYLEKYSIHFIKGSRSLQLESLFDIN
jgi:UDP-N-acetylmuramoyl-tripeptide--D-alanyl-D-alanine ligase